MSINTTTLSAAITINQTTIGVASATNITAPVTTTGVGITYLKVDDEMMYVYAVSGTQVSVVRGYFGTQTSAHQSSAVVITGGPADFAAFVPATQNYQPLLPYAFSPIGPPLTGATVAPLQGYIHHFTGSTALVTITVPAGLVAGGEVGLIFDGSSSGLTWTAAGNISVAGTLAAAKNLVRFFYDPSTSLWYPDRVA